VWNFSVSVDQFSSLCERVSTLERQISSFFSNRPGTIEDTIKPLEEGLESLRLSVDKLQASVEGELTQLTS
jgi:hypothetical protein